EALEPHSFLSETRVGVHGASAVLKARDPESASAALSAQGIAHDRRLGGLRASVHLYTSETDVDALADAARAFL
ncbi:MAG: hypothetical protein K2Q06_09330, partial [Parvularculaceae bacterium]|nr:hypothetical protein [Parvularculaceae bacterium]